MKDIIDIEEVKDMDYFLKSLSENTELIKSQLEIILKKYIPPNTNAYILTETILKDVKKFYDESYSFENFSNEYKLKFFEYQKETKKEINALIKKNETFEKENKNLKNEIKKCKIKLFDLEKNNLKNYKIFGLIYKKGTIEKLFNLIKNNRELKKENIKLKNMIGGE